MARLNFTEELQAAELSLLAEGEMVGRQLDLTIGALERRDSGLARKIIADDDAVDKVYLAIDSRILNLIALQAPVAGDLRLVSALSHCNLHLERMGDLCVNIAKFVVNDHPYPTESAMVRRLREMGDRAREMLDLGLSAIKERSVQIAELLPIKDDVIDRLNRGMLDDLQQFAGDSTSFEWATNLVLVARYLERFGDHAVDIGEQVSFLVTGTFREFTDASDSLPRTSL
ncbi:MAG: phosphate transport system protein [Actinomycetota bacterium]|jgi:phosphate transport system protein|nr:phosphate transport system protein [Actinomycetota bacterium]